jgi:hypothetical protein
MTAEAQGIVVLRIGKRIVLLIPVHKQVRIYGAVRPVKAYASCLGPVIRTVTVSTVDPAGCCILGPEAWYVITLSDTSHRVVRGIDRVET